MFETLTLDSPVCKAANILTPSDLSLVKAAAADKLKPCTDFGSTIEMFLLSGSDSKLKRLVLGALPSAKSRSNTPARSHALGNLVKSSKGSGNVTVIVCPKDRDYAFAQAISVG
jgi:hypothetical protein